ncbi:MAG: hypothetical protein WC477_03155 [Patescibacteria group bacterium]
MKFTPHTIFAIGVSALIVAAAVTGIFIVGAPKTERQYRLDEQRVSDLEALRSSVIDPYYASHKTLPATLEEAGSVGQYSGNIFNDPETQQMYEYHPTVGTQQYALCAVFDLPTNPKRQMNPTLNHSAGRTCFDFTVGIDNHVKEKQIPVVPANTEAIPSAPKQ